MESQAYFITRYLVGLDKYQLSTTWPLYTQDEVAHGVGEQVLQGPLDLVAPLMPGLCMRWRWR
jgi:hypothetical protein